MLQKELARLQALADYAILDSEPEEAFDSLTALAADLFGAPIALVSLVDAERQWFKSRHGIDAESTPRSQAFCAHALDLEPGESLVVADPCSDPRFTDNPLVTGAPNIRFYTGAVLTGRDGHNLGTLCVIDTKARPEPSPEDLRRLAILARMVVDQLELRRATKLAKERGDLLAMAEAVAGFGHWRFDPWKRITTWSDQMYRIYGLEPGTPVDIDLALSMTHPLDAAAQVERLQHQMRTGESVQSTFRIIRKDGEVRHLSFKSAADCDDHGAVVALVGTMIDITERWLAEMALADEHQRLEEALDRVSHLAQHDALTGLPNRLLFNDRVRQACAFATRNRSQFALAYLDLDGFKAVNDTMGHSAGDALLKVVSTRLTGLLRASDTVCRLGGDEFVVLMQKVSSAQAASDLAKSMVEAVSVPYPIDGRELRVSTSVGVAMFPGDGQTPDELIRKADAAMYAAKGAGKNQFWLAAKLAA